MSELFEDEEDSDLTADDEFVETEDVIADNELHPTVDARKRLESLMEERRLRDELEDFLDF